jgi:hypothetical protein
MDPTLPSARRLQTLWRGRAGAGRARDHGERASHRRTAERSNTGTSQSDGELSRAVALSGRDDQQGRSAAMRAARILWLLLLGSWVVSCDSIAGPRDESELEFVRFPDELWPLAEKSAAVWAVKGQNRVLSLRYRTSSGPGSDEFLSLEIPADALWRRPSGELFQPGDSVLITVQVGTDRRMLFDFEPSGLLFNPSEPARLRIEYRRLGGDLNGDGTVDETDTSLEWRTRIWRQEQPGDDWYPIPTTKDQDADEARATITSFTGFVIAA